jgi:acetyl esterase/lipase
LGVDPNRIVGSGGSGGAHLVALATTSPELHQTPDSRPDALILHYPLLDWVEGGSMTERFHEALNNDPELARRLSPAYHWSLEMPPTLLFIGTREPTFEANKTFAEKWQAAGAPLEVFIGEAAGHGFSSGPDWIERAIVRADKFLGELGYVAAEPRAAPPAGAAP